MSFVLGFPHTPMQSTTHKIIIGDARRMRHVADDSIQLVVTSPPYWQLKDYGNARQIGFGQSYEDYINHLNLVWAECYRVLQGGCRLCVNIGDQFARSVYYGRYKVIPIKTEIIKFCESLGFDYMGAIIWQKTATMNTSGGGAVMGSFPYPRNGIVKLDYESILLFKKIGGTGVAPKISQSVKQGSKLTTQEWNTYFSGHWNFGGAKQDKHLAMFPLELPNRLIKMFSFVGETVLDPFLGSGTTSLSALNLQRHSVGYEINPDFRDIIREKVSKQTELFASATVEFLDDPQPPSAQACAELIAALPYQFRDTVKMERKIDPKKLTFGSKIDRAGNGLKKDRLFSVREIIQPDKLRLSSGITVRMLGITCVTQKNNAAISFIQEKTRGQKVFLKFDTLKYDDKGNLLCYLYLANKTFINAHLIKAGLAVADTSIQYQHRNRFLRYQAEAENGK